MSDDKLETWEAKLRVAFDAVDAILEKEYGDSYPLHPARPKHGATANCKYDGLFSVSAAYSAGFGSKHGEGYVIEVRMVTLAKVPKNEREEILEKTAELLRKNIPVIFPKRELKVIRDGHTYKIIGNLDID